MLQQLHDSHDHHVHGNVFSDKDQEAFDDFIWRQETVTLRTVGIDIGSSTSHLLFAKVVLQRRTEHLSSRFMVIERSVLWQSPITLTPFTADGLINAAQLADFIQRCYNKAGVSREDIDSGAVILTGEAIKRRNARAIDELFADQAGKFVCATAGHKLECLLAAHGSGAVQISKDNQQRLLHMDIGGGTTKLAMIDRGNIVSVAAFAVGGRLLAQDDAGEWTRIDDSAHQVAEDLGLMLSVEQLQDESLRQRMVERMVDIVMDYLNGNPLDRLGMALQLTEALERPFQPKIITVSGGVSEYVHERETEVFGDIAQALGRLIRQRLLAQNQWQLKDPGQGIRATVIGASQFTVQVSGKTIYLPDKSLLPLQNVPVVNPHLNLSAKTLQADAVAEAIRKGLSKMDLNSEAAAAIMVAWDGDPAYDRLHAVAEGIYRVMVGAIGTRTAPLVLMVDGDVGRLLGRILHHDLGLNSGFISLDGIELKELDFVDLGQMITPPGVIPVVIKSLLFG